MQQKFNGKQFFKAEYNNRVAYLYHKVYKPKCKSKGLRGEELRREALKLAKAHYKAENKAVQQINKPKPELKLEASRLLEIRPKKENVDKPGQSC